MRIHNLYSDDEGESHFRDIEIEWIEEDRDGCLSSRIAATAMTFRKTSGNYANDWHNPLRRQLVINLDAAVEITASDGECRTIGIGDVLLLDDLHGKGHVGKAVDGKLRHSVLISIDDNSRFGRVVR